MTLDLDTNVTALDGIGPGVARKLHEAFGITSVRGLLEHYPRRWQHPGKVVQVADVQVGQRAPLIGHVLSWSHKRVPPRGKRKRPLPISTATVAQSDGNRFNVTYFNQRWKAEQLPPQTVAAFSGEVKRFGRQLIELTQPDTQVLGTIDAGLDERAARRQLNEQPLLAIYPAVEALPSFKLSRLIASALDAVLPVEDWLPASIRGRRQLIELSDALRGLHQPKHEMERRAAEYRLKFDELFTLQLGMQWRRRRMEAGTVGLDNGPDTAGLSARFLAALPFSPTGAQAKAFNQIGADLASGLPMHRLLQGDVGSGKTIVALWSMLAGVDNDRQAALMAPTEVLAEQHFRTLTDLLAPLGVNVLDGVRVELLTSSTTVKQRRRILGELLSGQVDLIVGTHALLEEGVRFADLGVVVIDEQHRFGVSQRVRLKEKTADAGAATPSSPDVLVMTATPIPRSLALTRFGDLDVTVLDELPPGRQPITTQLILPNEAERRERLYEFIRAEVGQGRRAYVVCPFVEPSATVPAAAAVDEHERLSTEVFGELNVGLLHGRLSASQKDAVMGAFRTGEVQILVSTTVIEVGVDVPEATIMVIEDAERFGISQLHQLRGRVGRGGGRSFCVLFAGFNLDLSEESEARLAAVAATTDGFELARKDLELRGQGQLFGQEQSGTPDLKLARVLRDMKIVEQAQQLARATLDVDPELANPEYASLYAELERRFHGELEVIDALSSG